MRIESAKYTKEKDVFLIQYPNDLYSNNEIDEASKIIKKVFPNNDLLFLPSDFQFSIIREENPFL